MQNKVQLLLHLQNFKHHRWAVLFKIFLLHHRKIYHYLRLCKKGHKNSAFNYALGNFFAKKLSMYELWILFEFLNKKNYV